MVVGNGMIARRFADYEKDDGHIIFASGVSNSGNKDEALFFREKQLLEKTIEANAGKKLVYFSTCSIYDVAMQATPYVLHKLFMEELIIANCDQYCIFRVSNPVGVTDNPNTVLNYFVQHIAKQIPFEVWKNASRNLIDIDDMYLLCDYLLGDSVMNNQCINIANPNNYTVTEIIISIEEYLSVKGDYVLIDKGNSPLINVNTVLQLLQKFHLYFSELYLEKLLKKYYSHT